MLLKKLSKFKKGANAELIVAITVETKPMQNILIQAKCMRCPWAVRALGVFLLNSKIYQFLCHKLDKASKAFC